MMPFVYAAAFEKGAYPGTVVLDSALDNRTVMIGGTTGILGEWGPERPDNRYEGPITAREALAKSKNSATVRLGMQPGVEAVLQLASNAGIKTALRPFPATFLGASEFTIAELALAYTIFPNGGTRPTATHLLTRITDKDGNVVWQPRIDRSRRTVLKPEIAYEVHSCLVDALEQGTGRVAYEKYGLKKMPAAGKTGTAYDFTDVLFAGYDSALTCVVWAGFDKPRKIYRGAFGSEIALPVWTEIMNASLTRYPPREIKMPGGLERVEVCSKSGLLATDKCFESTPAGTRRTTYQEIATRAQRPVDPCNVHGPRRPIARDLPQAEWPRAALAVDTEQVSPVNVKGPALLADRDPWGAVRSTEAPPPVATPTPMPEPATVTAAEEDLPDPSKPVLRAEPVGPTAEERLAPTDEIEVRRAEPNEPVEVRKAEAVGADERRERILPAEPVEEPEEEW